MSIPIRAPLWISQSASGNHLLSEEIDQQEWRIALRAVTAQANGPSKELAFGAPALADGAFTADGAFVHGLRHDCIFAVVQKQVEIGIDIPNDGARRRWSSCRSCCGSGAGCW